MNKINCFFVKIFSHYLNEICEVYTYCLMQNHFRFLSKSKKKVLLTFAENAQNRPLRKSQVTLYKCLSKRTSKLIGCYNQSYIG
jgi:hypothetical protein